MLNVSQRCNRLGLYRAWGFTGLILRASVLAWDLRRNQPYEVYNEIDFEVPLGNNGDCYDSYQVRMAEIEESLKIIDTCLQRMPAGSVMVENFKVSAPPQAKSYGGYGVSHSSFQALHKRI